MKIFQKTKLWIIIALAVVVVGAIIFAFAGFNQTPDYKTSYEVQVTVDQNVSGSGEIVKKTTENYFKEINYKYSSYATQSFEDGSSYIYKFNDQGKVDKDALKTAIENAFTENGIGDLQLAVTVSYKQTVVNSGVNVWLLIAACAISLVAAFIVVAIMNKFASAFTVICNACIAMLVYLAVIAITRIPASTTLAATVALSGILTLITSFIVTCRYKEALKAEGKSDIAEVAAEGVNNSAKLMCFVAIVGVLAAIALSVSGTLYLVFTGLQILFGVCSAYLVTMIATPALWKAFKQIKGNK